MNNHISAFIHEIQTQKVHQYILEKTCGALATFHGIKIRPSLMKKFIDYVKTRLETDKDFYNAVIQCKNWYGMRQSWYNVFVYCVYGYDGKSAINVEKFLNFCFPNLFAYKVLHVMDFMRLPIRERIDHIENNAVIVSFRRITSGIFHWFNLINIQIIEYETMDEVKEESDSVITYTLYDVVGMAKSIINSSLITSSKDYLFSTGHTIEITEYDLTHNGQMVIIIK